MKHIFIIAVLLFIHDASAAEAATYNPNESINGIDLTAIDSSVKPCDNFYQFACGNWQKKTQLPSDKRFKSSPVRAQGLH